MWHFLHQCMTRENVGSLYPKLALVFRDSGNRPRRGALVAVHLERGMGGFATPVVGCSKKERGKKGEEAGEKTVKTKARCEVKLTPSGRRSGERSPPTKGRPATHGSGHGHPADEREGVGR